MADKDMKQHKEKSLRHGGAASPRENSMNQTDSIARNAMSSLDYDKVDKVNNVDNVDIVNFVDITDDYMFSTVMQDPELCRELLERLLPGCKIKKVSLVPLEDNEVGEDDRGMPAKGRTSATSPLARQAAGATQASPAAAQASPPDTVLPSTDIVPHSTAPMLPEIQKTMSLYYGARGIRMDVYLEDDEQIYDIEMQATRDPYLAKRSFLYQSHLGISQTRRGCGYDSIRPCFVIFICTYDPFGKGLFRYGFRHWCDEDKSLELKDGARTIIFNTTGHLGDASQELRELLRYMNDTAHYPVNECDDPLIRRIDEAVQEAKSSNEWRRQYMIYHVNQRAAEIRGEQRGEAKGRKDGIAIGRKDGMAIGEDRMAALNIALLSANRADDLMRASQDEGYRESLFKEFGISYPSAVES